MIDQFYLTFVLFHGSYTKAQGGSYKRSSSMAKFRCTYTYVHKFTAEDDEVSPGTDRYGSMRLGNRSGDDCTKDLSSALSCVETIDKMWLLVLKQLETSSPSLSLNPASI